MSNVSRLIHAARLRNGRTLTDLAAAVKKSLPYMSRLERGLERGTPANLRRIGAELGIDEGVLYDKYIEDAEELARQQWLDSAGTGEYSIDRIEYIRRGKLAH